MAVVVVVDQRVESDMAVVTAGGRIVMWWFWWGMCWPVSVIGGVSGGWRIGDRGWCLLGCVGWALLLLLSVVFGCC